MPRQIQQSRRRNQHTAHELKGQSIETEDASRSLFLAVVCVPFFLERSADFLLSFFTFRERTQHRNTLYVFHHLTDQMLLGLLVNGSILGGAKPHPTQDQHPKCQPHKANPAITGLKRNIITDISTAIATPLVICSIASMEYPSRSAIVVVSMA